MNWFVTLFLWGCTLPVLPIEYFVMRDEIKFKKNIVVGVTLPYEARSNTDVVQRLEQYRRELKRVCMLLLAGSLPCMLIRKISVAMFVWGIWLLLAIVLPNIPYARCNRELKKIKHENGWEHQSRNLVWVDTAAISKEKWLSPWLFAPAVLCCLLPVAWDTELILVYVLDAVCALSCWAGYRYLYRNRAEVVDANQDLSQVLSHVRRRNWGKVWLYCAYSLALVNLSMWLMIRQAVIGLVLILLLCALLMCAAVRIELLTRRVQEKLTAESGKAWYADEDDKWIWGLVYYNPNDTRVIINNRVGINSTINVARPAGKLFVGITAIILLLLPFTGILLDGIGSKPLDLQVSGAVVTASYGSSFYEVALEDIEEVELLDALPEGLRRVGGTGAETLLKGKFRSSEYGSLTLCLDPSSPPFLRIKTTYGRQFLFGTRESTGVEDIFARINE